jgi:hypothetical protein
MGEGVGPSASPAQAGEVFSGQIQTDQDVEVLGRNTHTPPSEKAAS